MSETRELDLDAIKARYVRDERGWLYVGFERVLADAEALLAEVERLRALLERLGQATS